MVRVNSCEHELCFAERFIAILGLRTGYGDKV